MVCDNENKNGPKAKNITISYLRRMIFYADALANGNDATTAYSNIDSHAIKVEEDGSEGTGEELVSILARKLLLAADPSNLISSLTVPFAFFPKNGDNIKNEKDQDDTDEDDDDDDVDNDEEENNYPPYYKLNSRRFKGGKARDPTRIDALRSLLRALAPIALDIATRASCHVLMSNRLGMNGDHIKREKNIDDTNGNAGASKASSSERERLQVFILFGFWVPLAPQLSPIISDLFGEFGRFGGVSERSTDDESSACPLGLLPFVAKKVKGSRKGNHIKSNNCEMMQEDECERIEAEEAVVASEAARELLEFYCFKRYENDFARKWWDWDTPLFLLIHTAGPPSTNICNIIDGSDDDGDAIMDGNAEKSNIDTKVENLAKDLSYYIGGHSPETNAPHCIEWKNPSFQMKWHASRAVGALFSLRPLPLSNFLKKLSVYESDVPFMRHPWSIYEEEAVWESNLMHGVGKIVLPKADQVKIKYGHHVNELLPAVTFQEDGLTIKSEESKKTSIDGNGNDECTFQVPSIEDIRKKVPVHPSLIHVGKGILVPRRGSVASYDHWCRSSLAQKESQSEASNSGYSFIPTDTTMRNMSLLGVAMSSDPHPPPVLVCGPPGSGKSSLVRELARLCSSFASSMESSTDTATYSNNRSRQLDELLELHVDEETDSKTLLGSYVATDIPGEFIWMAGPLTSAARLGRWVLIEDVDRCPEEIQAALLRLLEERILPLGVGKDERCHPGFRLFGTCVTMGVGGKRVLHPNLWRKVHVDPLPFTELREVGRRLYPGLPHSVSDAALDVLRKLDRSGRGESFKKGKTAPHSDDMGTNENYTDQQSENNAEREILGHGARHASVREYTKLLSRISSALDFEPGSEYATESQRLICLVETVDVFAMACPCFQRRRSFICQVAAPIWALTADAATRYVEDRIPVVSFAHNNRHVEVGRARLMTLKKEEDEMDDVFTPGKRRNFAETSHALRFMESIAVCASENEPALLVGETGKFFLSFNCVS